MKATGIVRRIDDLGRVVIPKEIRRTMRIREGDHSLNTLIQSEVLVIAMDRAVEKNTQQKNASLAQRYDVKGRKYIGSPLKYYFSDVGLRNARLNFRQQEENHIMENVIFNELCNRDFSVDVGVVEYCYKDDGKSKRTQLEIDFVANKGSKRYYVQSALTVSDEEKRKQEINSLKRVGDSFKKIVVVKDNILPWHDDNGILYVGIEQFLLDESAMDI